MLVIVLSLIPPFLWSVVNYVDKVMLSDRFDASIPTLMLYSTGFSVVALAAIAPFALPRMGSTNEGAVVLVGAGLLLACSIHLYLYALTKADVAVVIALSLLTPLFGYFFSYTLLGESLTVLQGMACTLIICCAAAVAFDFSNGKPQLQQAALFAMLGVSACQAAQETLFKFITTTDFPYAVSLLWLHMGMVLYGLLILALIRGSGRSFITSVRTHGRLLFSINMLSEGLSTAAYGIRAYALLLAPVTVVMTLNAFQPVFVLVLGVLLSLLLPKFVKESLHIHNLAVRTVAIILMVGATIVLTLET